MQKTQGRKAADDYGDKLRALQQRRIEIEGAHRKDDRSYSLVGLRLATILNQLQAVQALQGLQELTPKAKGPGRRFAIPEDAKERAAQRQWLAFKADWLESLLEDTVDELRTLDDFDQQLAANPQSAADNSNGARPRNS